MESKYFPLPRRYSSITVGLMQQLVWSIVSCSGMWSDVQAPGEMSGIAISSPGLKHHSKIKREIVYCRQNGQPQKAGRVRWDSFSGLHVCKLGIFGVCFHGLDPQAEVKFMVLFFLEIAAKQRERSPIHKKTVYKMVNFLPEPIGGGHSGILRFGGFVGLVLIFVSEM